MKQTKQRLLSLLLALVMTLGLLPSAAFAATTKTITAYVTVSVAGQLATGKSGETIAQVPVTLTGQSEYNIDDALRALHEQCYNGGAEVGYASATTTWGLSITKLWGDESDAFGYLVNQVMANSLGDTIKNNDYIDAYVYKDTSSWSDSYSYFTPRTATLAQGGSLELTLNAMGYDANWNTVFNPLAGATLTVNGTAPASAVTTDAEGKATLTFDTPGTYVVSATSATTNLVPPTCVVEVLATGQATGISATDLTPAFDKATTSYTIDKAYGQGTVTITVTAPKDTSIYALTHLSASTAPEPLANGKLSSLKVNAGKNEIKLYIGNTSATPYTVTVNRAVALSALALTQNGANIALSPAFKADTGTYTATALTGSKLVIAPTVGGDKTNTILKINGNDLDTSGYTITTGTNTFTIALSSKDNTQKKTYTLTVTGVAPTDQTITVPTGATLSLTDPSGNAVTLPTGTVSGDTTSYTFTDLMSGQAYTWRVGQYGYHAQGGTLTAGSGALAVTLTPATEPSSTVEAQWSNFRNSDVNMAITSAQTPRSADETALKWVTASSLNVSSGFLTQYPSPTLIVDGKLITTSGKNLVQLDLSTGAEVKRGAMADSNGAYGNAPLAYGGGMIYVPLVDGRVQAFDAQTLGSCWISESLGKQCTTALIYDDGYLYGSTGNSAPGKFFCLQVADEDTGKTDETKYATWIAYDTDSSAGSYWSHPLVTEKAVVYGTDAGYLYSRDKQTGEELSKLTLSGKQRSGIAYANGRVYGGTQSGYLFSAALDSSTGELSDLKTAKNETTQIDTTPVVYNDVVYYGTKGKVVAADADTLALLRSNSFETTTSVIQSSPLLTTAYDGKVYLYFTQNCKPGALYVVEDDGSGLTISTLYTPDSAKQQYCNVSPICDADGTIYYRNDSGYFFALSRWSAQYCPVTFNLSPADATLTVTDSAGQPVQPATASGIYDLPAGTYHYTAASGSETKDGTLTIPASYASAHTAQSVSVVLTNGGSSSGPSGPSTSISFQVSISVADPQGQTYLPKTSYTVDSSKSVYDLLCMTGLSVQSTDSEYGKYVQAIEGLGEFDQGSQSGWMFKVNGVYPSVSASSVKLNEGDEVEWLYTRSLGSDIGGGGSTAATTTPPAAGSDQQQAETTDGLIQDIGQVDLSSGDALAAAREAYNALTDEQKALVENYDQLRAAERAYASLHAPDYGDVEEHWAKEDIQYISGLGLMQGVGGDNFAPQSTLNRAMLITILYRLDGAPDTSAAERGKFTDVPDGSWYTDAVHWAAELGLVGGYGNGKFGPEDLITREQLATILLRYSVHKQYDTSAAADLSGYADRDKISNWAQNALAWANELGLITGRDATTLAPDGSATRGEAATILSRYLDAILA